jgi:poly-gamma-glutamate synthase PgsB/CapB
LTVLLISLSVFVLYLIYERAVLDRLRRSIPLVITVTGTRGKSTVVRLLASILRESGKVVLAKSTGSQAQFVLPDGTLETVARRGMVSILEQKKALRKAAALKADCLVVEIMSIRPENHIVESQRVLKPNIVVLTNVRKDHTEAMGEKEEDVARVLHLDFPDGAEVFVLEEDQRYIDPRIFQRRSLRVNVVVRTPALSPADPTSTLSKNEFSENLQLAAAVAKTLAVDDTDIDRGIQKSNFDIGRFKIWTLQLNEKRIFAVNAFAANDPDSTMKVLKKTREILSGKAGFYTGLLNLRSDRPDRTVQWIDALNSETAGEFSQLYVIGGHANVVKRKVEATRAIASQAPDTVTQMTAGTMGEDDVIFGFGNIGGAGERLVEYWEREGKEYGI